MKQIILASTSPRRRELMKKLGLPFRAVETSYPEACHPEAKPKDL
ncbi:MAG: Maf family protein [Candidatus Kerfeldbacteria bacterium]|nr:Maf family protein [Candidatus Kerfeldbacteria bacterium]